MSSPLDDFPVAHVEDLVGSLDRRDAMRNEKCGPASHELLQRTEDLILGLDIHAGEGIVEDQDGRTLDDRTRQGGALFLAAGETHPAFSEDRMELR